MSKNIKYLVILSALHGGLLVAANAAGAKLIAVGPLAASATVFIYAFSFLITDIISEIYGKKIANVLVWVGFAAVTVAVAIFQIAVHAPSASFFQAQEAYETVFGLTWRILLGGLVAYLVSQFHDVWIFHRLKVLTKGKHLWLRNNVSTLISQLIDTIIFITVAFYGVVPELLKLMLGQYIIKVVIAILDTPIAYIVIGFLKRDMNLEDG